MGYAPDAFGSRRGSIRGEWKGTETVRGSGFVNQVDVRRTAFSNRMFKSVIYVQVGDWWWTAADGALVDVVM